MPFIETKLSMKLDENQKNDLQRKLADVVSSALSKPKQYIMTEIEDEKTLYMNEKKLEKGAYISVKLFGATTKQACQTLTHSICNILSADFGIEKSNIYVTYHPVDLWGWNDIMF
ncbi:hypothetical protein IJ182_02130 [bacterium]|nr:hypothetical protein [bacterium]